MRDGDVRRGRLRLLRVSSAPGGAFDPPLLSLSSRHLRRIDPGDARSVVPLTAAREELWVRGDGARVRCTFDGPDKIAVRIERAGEEDVERHLVRVPTTRAGDDRASRYFGRWEHARDALVLSEKGAGVIVRPETLTLEHTPELVDVYEADGVLLALRNVPNGARVVAAEGVPGLTVDAFVSDVKVPEVERGPTVRVHPREAFLRGFVPIGFEASFAGLDFAGFAPAHGDKSPDLARFLKKPEGVTWAAVRPIEPPEDVDETLTMSLAAELTPGPTTGRVRLGKHGTITLTDGRAYRVRAGVREHLPKGTLELVTCGVLDGDLLFRAGVPFDEMCAPDANAVLARLKDFLIHMRAVRLGGAGA